MIEAAKVVVPIGQGREIEKRATVAGLRTYTEPYPEEGIEEVIVETEDDEDLFEESRLVQAIGETQYSGLEVFVPNDLLISAHTRMQELGIPDAHQLSETEWTPGATYETRY